VADTGLEEDLEMREIFIEEAREVVANARASLDKLADQPDDLAEMTAVRRAFHTLKGSSRMVGLKDFGDAAWACEQLYNARLAQMARMDAPLRDFSLEALDYLGEWTEAIAEGRAAGHASPAVARAADSLRLEGIRIAIAAPGAPAPEPAESLVEQTVPLVEQTLPMVEPEVVELPLDALPEVVAEMPAGTDTLAARVPDLPTAADLDLSEPAPAAEAPGDGGLNFTLDLGALEQGPPFPVSDEPPPAPAVAEVEAIELDLSAFDAEPLPPYAEATGAPAAELVLPEPAPEVPAIEALAEPEVVAPQAEPSPSVDQIESTFEPAPMADELAPADIGPEPPAAEAPAPSEPLAEDEPVAEAAADVAQAVADPLVESEAPALPDVVVETGSEGDVVDTAPAPLDDVVPDAVGPEAAAEPAAAEAPAPELALAFESPEVLPEPDAAAEADAAGLAEPDTAEAETTAPLDAETEPVVDAETEPVVDAETGPVIDAEAEPVAGDDDQVKVIGDLRIGIPLFNIFLNEADELSRRLGTELAEWGIEHERHAVPESTIALAHSLAGNSATVGYADLSALARALEHALMRSHAVGRGRAGEPELFNDAAEEVRRLLHQFAAGFLRPVAPELAERLADHERWPLPQALTEFSALEDAPVEAPPLPLSASSMAFDDDEEIDAVDAIDHELFPIFEEEAEELLPQLQTRLRQWAAHPHDREAASACMRTLHTFKGGARLAGAMRVGELAHRLETAVEHLLGRDRIEPVEFDRLVGRADAMAGVFEALRHPAPAPAAEPEAAPAAEAPVLAPIEALPPIEALAPIAPLAPAEPLAPFGGEAASAATPGRPRPELAPTTQIDWGRFAHGPATAAANDQKPATERPGAGVVRVRGGLLDRLVNQAGEVSITRARLDADVRQLQASLNELTDSLDRLRRQLRDIELQAETQLASRLEQAKAASASFDPLEMDRFTRFQELTRFMAESVNDVATLQRSLQRTLQSTEDELALQARLTRELQDDLLRTRMVEFESMADRLYRVVRQAAKDTGKQVRLDIVGGAIEMDRGVLERMTGPFEHLLRNSVVHGIESPEQREAAGKERAGGITITITQEGNEVSVDVRDDGGGLDMARIRERAVERGLLAADAQPTDGELAQLIFAPGFSTATAVTELAGRGVGMDVVRAEVNAMGGRIHTASSAGRGTSFRLLLPLTTAVTQVVMLRCGELHVAVPSTLVEIVRRVKLDELERAYATGAYEHQEEVVPFYWLAALLQAGTRGTLTGRTQPVVVIRSAAQRVALHVDEVIGNQEVVVKNVGPQLARLPGLAGLTLLPSGQVALIYNPVALATLYGPAARERMLVTAAPDVELAAPVADEAPTPARAPLVLVVDDSLTVRRVTQRLLVREGYRVTTAKDGLDAIERLAEERPAVLLSDIEMPRMDGFDLVRNVRADVRLANLPVIMITSRIAQKHRDYAAQLGVDHYLGKPYSEEELLSLVARYAGADIPT
jgi:chemosensory pili system protein ChpA (sensor histidine kinase/response regulator)